VSNPCSRPRSQRVHARSRLLWMASVEFNRIDLLPSCRTKVMEQSPLISENSGYETIQIYR
jgi:hypothetical protein